MGGNKERSKRTDELMWRKRAQAMEVIKPSVTKEDLQRYMLVTEEFKRMLT
jgi:predicted hydrolase (HD superfamily)